VLFSITVLKMGSRGCLRLNEVTSNEGPSEAVRLNCILRQKNFHASVPTRNNGLHTILTGVVPSGSSAVICTLLLIGGTTPDPQGADLESYEAMLGEPYRLADTETQRMPREGADQICLVWNLIRITWNPLCPTLLRTCNLHKPSNLILQGYICNIIPIPTVI